jgi:hypothetical protein
VTRERVVVPQAVTLPVRRGQRIGHVEVFAAGKRVATVPLVATRDIAAPSLRDRAGWVLDRAGRALVRPRDWF